MEELSIATLGALRVTLGGEPVHGFRSDKERALLVYLAVESERPHRRETLTGLLWPEFPESNARHTLSQSLTNLRHALDDRKRASPYLDATRAAVALNAAGRTWVDVREFNSLLGKTGSNRGGDGENLGGRALERLAQAATLYQGAFLSGFSLADAPAFEEWLLLRRERLHRQVIETLSRLVDEHMSHGAYEEALRYGWRQVELDPWREAAQRQLIRLLGLTGQRSAALRQYEICRHILEEELGVAPDTRTRALHKAISAGTLVGDGPTVHTGTSGVGTSPQDAQVLPVPLMPLIGRETELEELAEILGEPEVRLLTLLGPGGIGKTRLALELARIYAPTFPDGAHVVPLVATTSWEACVAAIAQAVGLVASASEQSGPVEQQLLRYLRDKSMLLLLDNVEQLVDHAPHIVSMVESTTNLRVIATSRARLGVLGEVVFPVDALAVPEDTSLGLDGLSGVPAVQLFVRSAQRVAYDFRLSDDNAHAVVEVCRQVEGMPLALLLAASWADVLSPSQILERLTEQTPGDRDRPIDFLHATWSDMPARQQSMRAVFDHSWRLMRVREQAVLQTLSVFRGGFTAAAAFFVAGALLREVRRLVAQSLLSRGTGGRYTLHELLRQYAAERLSDVEVAERVARDRHASYYVGILRRWFEDAKGPRQIAALAEMDGEIDNVRAAWDWIVDLVDVGQMGQAVDGLCLYYSRRVRLEEGARACRAALSALEVLRTQDPTEEVDRLRATVRLLIWLSEFTTDQDPTEAVDRALDILSSPALSSADMRVECGRARRRKADLLVNTDRQRARICYEQSLSLLRDAGDRWEEARVLDRLATLTMRLTDFAAAQAHCENLLLIGRTLGDLHAIAYALRGLSNNRFYQGRPEEALSFAEDSLIVRRELGDPLEIITGLQALALRYLGADMLERALPLYDESIALTERLGLPAPYAKGVKAWGLMLYGRYEEADSLAHRALSDARRTGERRLVAWSEYVLGSLALVSGEVEAAIAQLSHCVDEFRALGEMAFLSMMLSFLGYAYRVHGQPVQAQSRFAEALRIVGKTRSLGILAWALPGMGMLYADGGRAARAHALEFVVAQSYPLPGASVWLADVAGPDYHAAMDALTPEEIAEAEAAVLTSDMHAEARVVLSELEAEDI